MKPQTPTSHHTMNSTPPVYRTEVYQECELDIDCISDYLYGPLRVQPTTQRICRLSNMEVPAVHQLPDVALVEFLDAVLHSHDSQSNSHP